MRVRPPWSRPFHHAVTAVVPRLAFLFTAVVVPQLALAQTTTGTISGRATDATNGVPMVGVSVRVAGTQLGAQTADDGRYTIRGVPAGTVSLQANRIGYEAKKSTVTVVAGQTV